MNEFETIGEDLGAIRDQFFGNPCFKVNDKAFIAWFEDEMVFKLSREQGEEVLEIEGTKKFNPNNQNKPLKEWIQVPASAKAQWADLAEAAMEFVDGK